MRSVRALGILSALFFLGGFAACAGRGRQLFASLGCVNCHRHGDIGNGDARDLTGVGERHDGAWIRRQITDPRSHEPQGRMPPYPDLRGFDLLSLEAFLRSR